MLSVAEALAAIRAEAAPLPVELVPLRAALGRFLGEPIVSAVDSPPFDKSMMDGYALRAESLRDGPRSLRLLGELPAGATWSGVVQAEEAVRIMTGAPIPSGCDAVVRLEDTALSAADCVAVQVGPVAIGLNIISRGQMLRTGELVLEQGRRLRPQELAVIAEQGLALAPTVRPPRVAVLATGDELQPPGTPLGPGQICNSNETLLLAQLAGWGCEPVGLGIARDDLRELREKVGRGLELDLLILTGGVSMGARDLVPQVLRELGVEQVFHKVQLKPGKPIWFGVLRASTAAAAAETAERTSTAEMTSTAERQTPSAAPRCLIFALPGNPVSTMVCSELFVRPTVRRLAGDPQPEPPRLVARLQRPHRLNEDRPTYFPAWLELAADGPRVVPTAWQGSGDLRSTADANAMIAFPAGVREYAAGESVEVVAWQ